MLLMRGRTKTSHVAEDIKISAARWRWRRSTTAHRVPTRSPAEGSQPWSEAVGPAIRSASLKGHPPLRSRISERTAGAIPPRHLRGKQLSRISVALALSSPTSATCTTRVIGPDGLRHDIVTPFDTLLTGSRL